MQLIVTAPAVPGETYTSWDNSGLSTTDVHFSGMFSQFVLIELLELQTDILALTAEYNGTTISLGDICLRPLCNDSAGHRDPACSVQNCTIFSPLNWFQVCSPSFLRFLLLLMQDFETPPGSSV